MLEKNVALAGEWELYDDENEDGSGSKVGDITFNDKMEITHLDWDDIYVGGYGGVSPAEDINSSEGSFSYSTQVSICNNDTDTTIEVNVEGDDLLSVCIDASDPGDGYDGGFEQSGELYARRKAGAKRPAAAAAAAAAGGEAKKAKR